ncbi:COX assembly mitochondrial protein homolog isoform X2 [Meriones unguiculatus]|uniref:COX assembly mitochondrial protein homolog isoform X2 n=1 Tax=Meriones unguiculatus TaxID=10047 RepID=UPI00293F2820|nr:COX assembly mitochondrial protein homolog isoform X2 [Meriones unguiculatus]
MALDPADQHLRHVEKDVLIPKIMREKARERCSEQVGAIMIRPSMKNANWNISKKGKNSEELEFLPRKGYRSFPQACRQIVSQEDTDYGNRLQCKPEMMN